MILAVGDSFSTPDARKPAKHEMNQPLIWFRDASSPWTFSLTSGGWPRNSRRYVSDLERASIHGLVLARRNLEGIPMAGARQDRQERQTLLVFFVVFRRSQFLPQPNKQR